MHVCCICKYMCCVSVYKCVLYLRCESVHALCICIYMCCVSVYTCVLYLYIHVLCICIYMCCVSVYTCVRRFVVLQRGLLSLSLEVQCVVSRGRYYASASHRMRSFKVQCRSVSWTWQPWRASGLGMRGWGERQHSQILSIWTVAAILNGRCTIWHTLPLIQYRTCINILF